MALSQDFLYDLHARNDIVEVINSYVPLKKRGRIYTALCPFHNEKTPSFVVYPDTQSFYCFGCSAGGDVITFIKQRENLDYIETVKLLAARAGMKMPEEENTEASNQRRRILDANKAAARFFVDCLNTEQGKHARKYLRERKLNDKTIRRFGLGYAPEGWQGLADFMKSKGFTEQELIHAGLCARGKKGGVYDFFRNRLMFPVIDIRGNVVAFSGRRIRESDSERKYVNSPDTPVFKKSSVLYAMNYAKNAKQRRFILAEGQMDAISLHQAGFDSAVAALGTAFTDEHARQIAQYADEIVVAYDADEAGQRATKRVIEIFKKTNLLIRVLHIEGAKDADEYIKKFGPERFAALLEQSDNSVEYELGRAQLQYDIMTDSGKVQYLKEASLILGRCTSPTEREIYAGRVSELLNVSKSAILEQSEQAAKRRVRREQQDAQREMQNVARKYNLSGSNTKLLGAAAAERRLLAVLFKNPDFYAGVAQKLTPADFISNDVADIYVKLGDAIGQNLFFGLQSITGSLSSDQISFVSGVLAASDGINASREDVEYLVGKIKQNRQLPDDQAIQSMEADTLKAIIEQKKKSGSAKQ